MSLANRGPSPLREEEEVRPWRDAQLRHQDICVRAHGSNIVRPKHHHRLHLPCHALQLGCVPDCSIQEKNIKSQQMVSCFVALTLSLFMAATTVQAWDFFLKSRPCRKCNTMHGVRNGKCFPQTIKFCWQRKQGNMVRQCGTDGRKETWFNACIKLANQYFQNICARQEKVRSAFS